VTKKYCREHIEKDFILKELKLRSPLSKILSLMIEQICLPLMNYLKVIPVFRRKNQIRKTVRLSLEYLEQGKILLIFPEKNEQENCDEQINPFYSGFINLARSYYRLKKRSLKFYPVAVHKSQRFIKIGNPTSADPEKHFKYEKQRILDYLHKQIAIMYKSGTE